MTIKEWEEKWGSTLGLESYESVTGLVAQAILDMAEAIKELAGDE